MTARFNSRPEARGSGPEAVFRFLGSGVDFFKENSLQDKGREWEKETQCGKGLESWDT